MHKKFLRARSFTICWGGGGGQTDIGGGHTFKSKSIGALILLVLRGKERSASVVA